MNQGYIMLVLHAHLPYVRHAGEMSRIEERWVFEAINECYLPLLTALDDLARDEVTSCLSMSLTPPLMAQLDDEHLKGKFRLHLDRSIDLAQQEWERNRDNAFREAVEFYLDRWNRHRDKYNYLNGDIVGAFAHHQKAGRLEILASAATHAFLPLMASPGGVRAQIHVGVEEYQRRLGRAPRGFWLPECAFIPGLDYALGAAGLEYIIMETHGVAHACPRPRYGTLAPIQTPGGISCFARDIESSKQVWSAEEGYPGDEEYRDFYRDIGFEREQDYLRPFVGEDRMFTGLKYHRITQRDNEHKEVYHPGRAWHKAQEHAGNFVFNRAKQVEWYGGMMDRPPLLICPYDAELFGHWWFEGPFWLEEVLRLLADHPHLKSITAPEYLELYPQNQICQPFLSSWGYQGYSEVWLEGKNDWIYRHLHQGEKRMAQLTTRFPQPTGLNERALKQAVRELLLAQSSDWPFIMKTGTFPDYARKRVKQHLANFNLLYQELMRHRVRESTLREMEHHSPLFPEVKADHYRTESL